ncbi:MAG: GAF domain-containing protein, partial [Myxococcota bacterium]
MTSSQLLDEIPSELLDVVDEFARTSELEDVLRLAVRRLANLFELERASVVLFREDEDVGYVVLEHSNDTLGNLVVRLTDYPELQEVIRTERPIVIPDVLDDRLLQGVRSKIENAKNVHRSALLFPLVRKDRVVGALFLRGKEPSEIDATAAINRPFAIRSSSIFCASSFPRRNSAPTTRSFRTRGNRSAERWTFLA